MFYSLSYQSMKTAFKRAQKLAEITSATFASHHSTAWKTSNKNSQLPVTDLARFDSSSSHFVWHYKGFKFGFDSAQAAVPFGSRCS